MGSIWSSERCAGGACHTETGPGDALEFDLTEISVFEEITVNRRVLAARILARRTAAERSGSQPVVRRTLQSTVETRNAKAGGLAIGADFRDLTVAELALDAAGWLQ